MKTNISKHVSFIKDQQEQVVQVKIYYIWWFIIIKLIQTIIQLLKKPLNVSQLKIMTEWVLLMTQEQMFHI